ncbi:hypothetical protein C6361_13710 [Plantactinospora sp. BC1]|nr:hypothetical protein C6361_13710 [Plantactinospora sp. BC1]
MTPPPRAVPPAVERFRPAATESRRPGRIGHPLAVPTTSSRPTAPVSTPVPHPHPAGLRAAAPTHQGRVGRARPAPDPARAAASDGPGAAGTTTPPPVPEAVAGATPEAKRAAKRFLDTCLEIVNGYRPAGHVRALASPTDAAGMVAQLASATGRVSGRRRPGQPVRTVRLRRLRVCEPRPGVVEAAAAVGVAGRTWAMAFRIERRRGSWVGTSVALL